jgi:uncharacterized protein
MEINDKIIFDGATKTAIIMRDGIYMYLAKEVGDTSRPANEIVRVYRDKKEIEKAKARFDELQRLPITINHPFRFLNLKDENSYQEGTATDSFLKDVEKFKTLGCKLNLNDKAFSLYEKGVKELSCGWIGNFVKVNHPDYDFIQEFEDFNHIALLPDGRGGSLCSIIDNNINLIKIMSENKDEILNDIKKTIVDTMSEEKKAEDKKKKYKDEDELEKEEEEVKTKDKKKKAKDECKEEKETKDSAIIDAKSIQDAMISDFSSIFEAIDKGAVDVKDCIGKSPLEIKQKAVEKLAKKTIDLSNTAVLDAYFGVSVENYSHPSWTENKKVEDKSEDLASILNNINFKK